MLYHAACHEPSNRRPNPSCHIGALRMPPQPSRYLITALMLAHSMAYAADDASEWQCRAKTGGQGWECQPAAVTPGPYRLPPLPATSDATPVAGPAPQLKRNGDSRLATGVSATAITASTAPRQTFTPAELDWVPSANAGHCAGSYVDPLAGLSRDGNSPETSNLKVTADTGQLEETSERFVLEGGIAFEQGYRQGRSDRAEVLQAEDRIILDGNVQLREPGLLIRANSAQINTGTNTGTAQNVHFVAHNDHIRGQADRLDIQGDGIYKLTGSSYTTCEPISRAWDMEAGEINIDKNTGIGTAKHAVLHLQSVPVAYVPYMQFPVDDRRMTGFLWPSFSQSSRSGFEMAAPYYLNLAPQADATITPRYIDTRGMMYEVETRYRSPVDEWSLGMAYLNKDEQYRDDLIEQNVNDKLNAVPSLPVTPSDYAVEADNRWLINLTERGILGAGWRSRIDYTRVSDEDYFRDLDTVSIEARRQTHLEQTAELKYTNDLWDFNASVEDHQTLGDDNKEQYALLPHLELFKTATGESFQPDWLLSADYSFFDSDTQIRGQRLYVEPGITLPMRWAAGYITPTVKVRHVSYALNDSNENGVVYSYPPLGPSPVMTWPGDPDFTRPKAGSDISGRPSATVPMASLDAGLFFERDLTWGDSPYLQTLEPRLYYLYAEYEDQDNLPNFDTAEVDFSYTQLFRESRFNGYDRLDDADQTTVGLMSRFIDQQSGREVLNLAAGQIFYNRDRRVSTTPGVSFDTSPHSEIAAEAVFTPSDSFKFTSSISWDPGTNKTSEGGVLGQWKPTEQTLLNLGYRYRRQDPELDPDTGKLVNADVDQVEFSAVVPLNYQWRLFARWHYDITDNNSLETLGGIEYESCCWMVRAVYQEAIDGVLDSNNNNFVSSDDYETDYAFYLQFQLKGLGDLADKVDSVLDNAIPGFSRMTGR